jgi:hypothetical protein
MLYKIRAPIITPPDSHLVGPLGQGSVYHKATIYNTNTEILQAYIHIVSGIQTHDPSVQASYNISCPTPHIYDYLFCNVNGSLPNK